MSNDRLLNQSPPNEDMDEDYAKDENRGAPSAKQIARAANSGSASAEQKNSINIRRLSSEQNCCNNPFCNGLCGCCAGLENVFYTCASDIREGAVLGAWAGGCIPFHTGGCLGSTMDSITCNEGGSSCLAITFSLPVPERNRNCTPWLTEPTFCYNCGDKETASHTSPSLGMSRTYQTGPFSFLLRLPALVPALVGGVGGGALGAVKSFLCSPCSFFAGWKEYKEEQHNLRNEPGRQNRRS